MKAKFNLFNSKTNWVNGTIGDLRFEAKLFDTGSHFGINGGRVSKLHIWDKKNSGGDIVSYERGWNIEPDQEANKYYKPVMKLLESSPKRFD